MMSSFKNIFKIPDLKNRVLFTLGILVLYRIGCHIPTPGIEFKVLVHYFDTTLSNTLFGLYNMFAGGAFSRAAVFGLGIMPYISASIMIQLLSAVVPFFQRLQKEGEEGRKKINQITRYTAVFISAMQALGASAYLRTLKGIPMQDEAGVTRLYNVVPEDVNVILFTFIVMITMTAGTILVMWMGEQITERGIGNGISMIIFIGIVNRFPNALLAQIPRINKTGIPVTEIFILGLLIGIIMLVVLVTEGTRKIPVQYAKRVVGRKVYGGQSTYLPIRVSGFGVMAIIFAQSLMFFPQTIAQFFPNSEFVTNVMSYFDITHPIYWFIFGLLILFFTYFYAAIAFNPVDVADNMQKYGGFIPGIRPGKNTAEYIDHVLNRIMLPAAIFFSAVAIWPFFVQTNFDVDPQLAGFFGGTSLLIMVGVALDTLQQIESHLLMRHYEGFMKTGRIRGRRARG